MILSDWLKETGRSVDGLAEELGVRRQSVHRWINGTRFPKRSVIAQIHTLSGGKVAAGDWFMPAKEAAE